MIRDLVNGDRERVVVEERREGGGERGSRGREGRKEGDRGKE